MSEFFDKKRMTEQRKKKQLILPDKYLLLIKGPKRVLVVEGRKDFAEHGNREATATAWFQFMCKLADCPGAAKINQLFRMRVIRNGIKPPPEYNAMVMEHIQDRLLMCFGGRTTSRASIDSQEATLELFAYFEEINKIRDDEVQSILQEFGFALHDA